MAYHQSTLSLPDPDAFEKDFYENFEKENVWEGESSAAESGTGRRESLLGKNYLDRRQSLLMKEDYMESKEYLSGKFPEKDFLQKPPTRLERVKQWTRKRLVLVIFIILFLTVTTLWIVMAMVRRPPIEGLARISTDPGAKISDTEVQVPETVDKVEVPEAPAPAPAKEPPPEAPIPIVATFYSGVEGPKACRGHVIAALELPPPPGLGIKTAAQCYNFPNLATTGCANFVANKQDGCEARLFAEPNCLMYMNTHVFQPEEQARGGNWKSVSVQCGIPEPDPATLGKPPMADMISSLKDNDKKPQGRRGRDARDQRR